MVEIKYWTDGVEVEDEARQQIENVAALPIVGPHIAIMPDVHWGIGATVGSVIPTQRAIIPAAVGVDIGCGMLAVRTTVRANALDLPRLRAEIEDAIPIGGPGIPGSWSEARFQKGENWGAPRANRNEWETQLASRWASIAAKYPRIANNNAPTVMQLGTLGTGNHFIEICVEVDAPEPYAWIMLHSGSRGPGNRIGTFFIERAREYWILEGNAPLSDPNLAWLPEGAPLFDDYIEAVGWAQDYARLNRNLMLHHVFDVLSRHETDGRRPPSVMSTPVVNCHHNYVEFRGSGQYLTRKGAVSAKLGELGIIPGSMGARSFIVRGLGNPDSFESCSHGAGRRMSRGRAKKLISVSDHIAATAGVECRKDASVLDESPSAYKDIDAVMHAQRSLVEIVHTLKQIVCVKG